MCKQETFRLLATLVLWCTLGCSGPDEGRYTGKIGNKQRVEINISPDGEISLIGYWQEELLGKYERGTLKGEDMGALVFEGPENKKFKLRFLYEYDGDDLIIRAVQSRTYGPGARYVSTEEESVFNPPPKLSLVTSK